MARVVYSVPVSELIGSIGGTTYQSNNSGFIARSKPFNRKKRNTNQSEYKLNLYTLSQLYRDLSAADKNSWSAFALANPHINHWNMSKTCTGLNWFININSFNLLLSNPIVNTAPAYTLPTALPVMTATITATNIDLNSAAALGLATEQVYIFATPPLPSSIPTPRNAFRLIQISQADVALPLDLAALWSSRFGLSVGSDLFTPDNKVIIAVTKILTASGVQLPFSFARS